MSRPHLIAFRGKHHIARQDTCERFLWKLNVPVTAFFDYDPAGLQLAMAAPLFNDILWCGEDRLREKLNRQDLYAAQIGSARGRLEQARGNTRLCAEILMETGRGAVQEAFLKVR